MSGLSISPQDQAAAIVAAGNKYGVPYPVLVGMYGEETTFGSDLSTSSTGAVGPFQFMPATASTYHYPLVSNPTVQQFQQQAEAAAHLLSDLHNQLPGKGTSDWTNALAGYYAGAGGYSSSGAQAYAEKAGKLATQAPKALLDALKGNYQTSQTGPNVVNVPNPLKGVEAIAALLTSAQFWIRLGEALAGIILMAMGLRSLTGQTTGPGTVVRAARKVAVRA